MYSSYPLIIEYLYYNGTKLNVESKSVEDIFNLETIEGLKVKWLTRTITNEEAAKKREDGVPEDYSADYREFETSIEDFVRVCKGKLSSNEYGIKERYGLIGAHVANGEPRNYHDHSFDALCDLFFMDFKMGDVFK